jgi:hypothetical protein
VPTKNPRSSWSPSRENDHNLQCYICSAITLHGSSHPPEPITQLLIRSPRRRARAPSAEFRGRAPWRF